MTGDAADARRPAGKDRERDDGPRPGIALALLAATLLGAAFFGAITAGVLGTVWPYLVGVSALVLSLFGLARR